MAKPVVSDADILSQIPAARQRAARSLATRPHARLARYDRRTRQLHVTLTNGSTFSLPVSVVAELRGASESALSEVEVGPAGVGLHWPSLDADLTVTGLARLVFGRSQLLSVAGAAGGAARSPAKAAAARKNGQRGGRPAKRGGEGVLSRVGSAVGGVASGARRAAAALQRSVTAKAGQSQRPSRSPTQAKAASKRVTKSAAKRTRA
jgi:hypothetical protein